MSIQQLFLTASGTFQSPEASVTSKENIRERLNMHVKKRIQGQDIAQYSIPSPTSPRNSPFYSSASLSSTLKSTHPFLMSGAPGPMVVFTNSLISMASSNNTERTIPIPQIERQSSKTKQQPKKMTKKKKTAGNKKKSIQVDANQQAENLILNTKFSDDSNDFNDNSLLSGYTSPHTTNSVGSDKSDIKPNNSSDILSTVLSLKKNALMHDPYIIQFLSTIR